MNSHSVKSCLVTNVFEQWAVVLPPRHGMNGGPAVFTVVLQATYTATEEGCWFSIALNPMTLITHLAI